VVSARLADGEVFDSAKLKNTVRFLIENDMRNVVIDLGNLEYLYSDTINAFIASNRHMLEVSGRIAILTEHPKVQDILKRAGLDNIMRIYRSEAEMIADSKEILRQTSSYRIEELQKISGQPVEPPPVPKTEFDEFKAEMGQRLGSKLDNNELPQYQLGLNANAPAAPSFQGSPAPAPETAYPTFNPPGFSPTQLPESPAPGFQPAQPAPAFNYNTANGLASGNGAQAYPSAPAQGFGQPQANFDFPTVQLPVGQFGSLSQAPAPAAESHAPNPPSAPAYEPEADIADPRQRKPSQERMRSPNARKQAGRRVGGREFGGQEEEAVPASVEEERAPEPRQEEKFPSYGDLPPVKSTTLVEEARFPAKLIIFVLLLGLGVAVYYFLSKKSAPPEQPPVVETPAAPAEPAAPAAPQATAPAAQPGSPAQSAPANPQATAPASPAAQPAPAQPTATAPAAPATPPAAVTPPPAPAAARPAPAPAKPIAETPKPAPKPKASLAHMPKPRPHATERPAPAPAPSEEASAPKAGMLHITSEPAGAEVLVNFSKKGVTPLDVNLSNNSNKIIVRMAGYKRFETTLPKNSPEHDLQVTLEKEGGSEEPVAKAAPPKPAPEPEERKPEPKAESKPAPKYQEPEDLPMAKQAPAKEPEDEPKPKAMAAAPTPGDGPIGVIFLSSSPARADIIIDGKNSGKKTPAKLELPSGSHRIEMNKGGQKASVDQVVNEGKNKALHLILQ
jgi:anti-anti-sigma factor